MLSRHRRKKNHDKDPSSQQPQRIGTTVFPPIVPGPTADLAEGAEEEPTSPQHLAIYAAPTVDTLDDESLFLGGTYQRGRDMDEQSGVMRHHVHVSFTPLSVDTRSSIQERNYSLKHTAHSPTRPKKKKEPAEPSAAAELNPRVKQQQPRGDFQHQEDEMTVTVVPVNVEQRSAFESSKPVSLEEWHRAAQQLEHKNRALSQSTNNNYSAHKKLSPSLQHLKLLHFMQSVTTIRQLDFSPSVGIDSDVFVPWWTDALETTTNEDGKDSKNNHSDSNVSKLKRRMSSLADQRDGRYRSIHPVQATVSALPPVPPVLSNRKTRLPLRADVGFPGASEDEIRQKQMEINHETEWEHASPRIIVLVTSDDLGTAVVQEDNNRPAPAISQAHREWNGGGLEGMPWAGRDLLRAKELNALHFAKKSSILANNKTDSARRSLLEPNRTSVLAPPLDASYSRTLGWRPRPFHDRAPGMEYLLCCPVNVACHIGGGDGKPLLCSLALYNLPLPNKTQTGIGAYGKISEEFFFPAGDWTGKIQVDYSYFDFTNGANTGGGYSEDDLIQSCSDMKQKAIFSYDPLAICGDKTCLFWVLQIFEVANEDSYLNARIGRSANENYQSNKRSNSVTRLFKSKTNAKHPNGTSGSVNGDQESTKSFFDKFGTKFMTPLAYGITSVLSKPASVTNVEYSNMDFPKGKSQDLQLMTSATVPESQEDFVERLARLTMSSPRHGPGEESIHPLGDIGHSAELYRLQETSEGSLALELTSVSSVSDRSAPTDSSHTGTSSSGPDQRESRSATKRRPSSPTRKKKNITQRIWMSPVKATRSLSSSSKVSPAKVAPAATTTRSASTSTTSNEAGYDAAARSFETRSAGTANVFTSVLSADWLQCMLKEPMDTNGFKLFRHSTAGNVTKIPKLLCDVTGDFAVMLESRESSNKRSSLSRLPCHKKPGGFSAASEIREVLFLPNRPEKTYHVDIPPSFRSLMNLLYLYPKLLRYAPDKQKGNNPNKKLYSSRYSVRVRLVRTAMEVDRNGEISSATTALGSFFSQTPWSGRPRLEEVYTKVVHQEPAKKRKNDTSEKVEQAMRDEFKLQLPQILDGSYFLQFTLFELDSEECNNKFELSARAVADNSIPLSSSTVRDTSGGNRVATVIPNGCHRIRLGDFKFYIESRLISSIHIGDAAVAAAVRDFPVAPGQGVDDFGGFSSDALTSLLCPPIGEECCIQPLQQESEVSFPAPFANASDGTLVGHFQLLLNMHLSSLMKRVHNENSDCMTRNLFNLFQILNKVKMRLANSVSGDRISSSSQSRLATFLKKVVDDYEETSLAFSGDSGYEASDEQASDPGSDAIELTEARADSAAGQTGIVNEENDDDIVDEGAVRVRHRDSLRTEIERRLSRRASLGTDIASSTSVRRVAYGASKTDRMKVEAELYYSGGRFNHLFDDDETIVTSGTTLHNVADVKPKQAAYASGQKGSKLKTLDQNAGLDDLQSDRSSIEAATAAASRAIGIKPTNDPSAKHEEGFATRVKTVANVMLAPCGVGVGKSSTSPRRISLDCGRSSRRRRSAGTATKIETKSGVTSDEEAEERRDMFVLPGSDNDEDEDEDAPSERKESKCYKFRGQHGRAPWTFSASPKYVYESLFVLWSQAWPDSENNNSKNILLGFCEHIDVFLPLCLKSVALRMHDAADRGKAILDEKHMAVLEKLSMVLAKSIMLQYSTNDHIDAPESALLQALVSSEHVLDFFEGLFAVLHPQHMRCVIESYMKTLRECEHEHIKENNDGLLEFDWTKQSMHQMRLSRQLRLRAVEKLAVLPSFLAVNFPLKFSDHLLLPASTVDNEGDSTWKVQYSDCNHDAPSQGRPPHDFMTRSADKKLPESGWLALVLANEALSICALSCEAVVAEAISHIESVSHVKREGGQRKLQLERVDLLMFQSLAIHAITAVYELLLRRHAMDCRFQTNACRGRIAALTSEVLIRQSLQSVRWLARMESTHKVRSVWMLCLVYCLQEAPEVLIRQLVRSYCDPSDILIHRFIRLLRLSSSTFQSFVDQPRHSSFPDEIDAGISPWLLQESFNTICATTNIVVEECVRLTESNPKEQRKMIHSILDLFLHILTTPQSAVTHLRALGGALHALDQFGVSIFLEVASDNLQHWIRVILGLMNSTSLSVRSIAVDFVLSLLGSAFDLLANIDGILLVFVTVLPEVAAREIALFSVDGHVAIFDDLERSIWPLRRSFGDLEDANPLDDDRIDPELSTILTSWCRVSQAILDSVLIELRLKNGQCVVVGKRVEVSSSNTSTCDADEESVWEAASFFVAETGPMQRIRWLQTLKALHESKGQWVEAAETMICCSNTICDAIPHLHQVWRPSRFLLWSDSRRSTWLQTVGEEMGHPDRGNAAVVSFSDEFLEPRSIFGASATRTKSGKLQQPTLSTMCAMLTAVTQEAVKLYQREDCGMDEIVYARVEKLLLNVLNVLSDHGSLDLRFSPRIRSISPREIEEQALLRSVSISLSGEMTKLAERLLLIIQDEPGNSTGIMMRQSKTVQDSQALKCSFYVLVSVSGIKPPRFQESTTLPTFLDWNTPCVMRVPPHLVHSARLACKNDFQQLTRNLCLEVGKSLQQAIVHESVSHVELRLDADQDYDKSCDHSQTFIDVTLLHTDVESMKLPLDFDSGVRETKRFFYKRSDPLLSDQEKVIPIPESGNTIKLVEVTVAHTFPSVLSRQRALLTSEFLANSLV